MTIEQTPAPARSDVRRPATAPAASPTRPYVVNGMVLTAGAVAWAATQAFTGVDPHGRAAEVVFSLTSGLFQVGLLCLLNVLWRTRALGEGRLARAVIRLESVILLLAIGSTTVDGLGVSDLDQTGWLLLDACWPLSMLGMFLIGIRIAIAGRWHGPARFWPMVAESWAVVVIPVLNIFGPTAAAVASCVHLCVGYGVLGQIVARKND